jgi:RNA polymerase sigma-70 factor (ECF subfamily)
VEVVDLDALHAPSTVSPEVAADMRLLRDAIAALPEDQRVCVVLAEVQGWALADIARVLDVSESAVKMRLKRGRDQVRASLMDPRTTPVEVRHA